MSKTELILSTSGIIMKYEVWKSDEMGHDYLEATFTDRWEAYDYINFRERYDPGWHFRCVAVKGA